jgi:hypothetical protein
VTKYLQGPRSLAGLFSCADAAYNRGDVRGRLKYFERAQRLLPTHPVLGSWVAECKLALGEWTPAVWNAFEKRWVAEQWADYYRSVAVQIPRWTGEQSLEGKTLFVLLDGGYGDVFQNYRYTALLEQQGARVVWQVRPSQVSCCPGVSEEGDVVEGADYFCITNALPGAWGTTPERIPPPYRIPGVGTWAGEWPPRRIAIVSQGNPHYRSERYRSMPTWWGDRSLPVTWIEPPKDGDWRDTANLLLACDLCITVDTAIAHLAGCLGMPVWMLLSVRSDWRWLRDRTDTGWYPSVRIFRQRTLDNWREVLDRVSSELAKVLDGAVAIA